MVYDAERSLIHIFCHLYIFFAEICSDLLPIFKSDWLFSYCWVLRVLCIFKINSPLSNAFFANIFSSFSRHYLIKQKLLISVKSSLSITSSWMVPLVLYFKKSLPHPGSSGFSPTLICSFSSFIVWKLKRLIFYISSFLIHIFSVTNFPLSALFAASHTFW